MLLGSKILGIAVGALSLTAGLRSSEYVYHPIDQAKVPVRIASVEYQMRHLAGGAYRWVSPRQIMLMHQRRSGIADITLLDISSGKRRSLPALTRYFNGQGAGLTSNISASPDGKWLLWSNDGEDGAIGGIFGSTLDGTRHFSQVMGHDNIRWLPSASSWISLVTDKNFRLTSAIAYDLHGKPVKKTSVGPAYFEDIGEDAFSVVKIEQQTFIIVLTADKNDRPVTSKYRFGNRLELVSSTSFSPPAHAHTNFTDISPDGKSIAWICQASDSSSASIWTSDINGKNQTKFVDLLKPAREEISDFVRSLRWSPDSRCLAYAYRSGLYVIDTK